MTQTPHSLLEALSSAAPASLAGGQEEFLGRTANRSRIHAAYALLMCAAVVLVGRAFQLQVLHGASLRAVADRNRTRVELIVPMRGSIVDRHGVPLVRSIPRYGIAVAPADLPVGADRAAVLDRIAYAVETDPVALDHLLAPYGPRLTEPVMLREDLSYRDALRIILTAPDLTQLRLAVREQRDDPPPTTGQPVNGLSHVLGYVSRVNAEEYATLARERYRPHDVIGKTGLERAYEDVLRGTPGVRTITVDVRGRVVATSAVEAPVAGKPS